MRAGDQSGRVVVGVDCTPASQELLRWADRQAQLMGRPLVAVTAWRIDDARIYEFATTSDVLAQMNQMQLEAVDAALSAARAAAVERRVSELVPIEAFVSMSTPADLIVVGPRSSNVITDLLLGSVAEGVVSQAPCPVVVVHDAAARDMHRIVVGVDGSDCSSRAFDWAVQQAVLTGSRVDAVWAWEWQAEFGVYPYGAEEAAQEKRARYQLDQVLANLSAAHAAIVDRRLERGHPARVLLDASASADLLVVGSRGRGRGPVIGRLLGSVSQKVVRHARISVVVVH
jgi:nucleotide-binding universal stress UspA family protein